MRPRYPLFAKILAWLFLNLLVLAVSGLVLFQAQFHLGLDSLLTGRAGERLQALGTAVANELRDKPPVEWDSVLKNFGAVYQVDLMLFQPDGTQVAGVPTELPAEVLRDVQERRPGMGMGRGPRVGRGPGPRWEEASVEPEPKFMLRTKNPRRYWAGMQLPLRAPEAIRPWPVMLVVRSNNLKAGGLLIDPAPWLLTGLGALVFSVLFWLPMVRSVTRSLSQMTRVTEAIAQGDFTARVGQRRHDELGRLGNAINSMAERLQGFVTGQKRFLSDAAHELCSPVARMQVALGILEQRAEPAQKPYVEDAREEARQMSELVGDLLSFSRAGLARHQVVLQSVHLADLARNVVEREMNEATNVQIDISEGLWVMAERELLTRAVGNLLRNAIRYAGESGPIEIKARKLQSTIEVEVRDYGTGVAEDALQRIFDPFYRGDTSRDRETGGVGLGLAIVKTCIEACEGTVRAENGTPSGLRVVMTLEAAEPGAGV